MSAPGRLLFVGFTAALALFGFFCLTFTVDLRCEHGAERDLFCASIEHSAFHDQHVTVEARKVDEAMAIVRVLPPTRGTIAAELEAFAQSEDDAPYTKHVSREPLLLVLLAALVLYFPVALWRAIRSTHLAIDRQAGTVTIRHRVLGVATSRKVLSLRQTVTVIGKQKRTGQDLFLQQTRGEPVHIAWVPQHRVVADFAALKRLFPIGSGG